MVVGVGLLPGTRFAKQRAQICNVSSSRAGDRALVLLGSSFSGLSLFVTQVSWPLPGMGCSGHRRKALRRRDREHSPW